MVRDNIGLLPSIVYAQRVCRGVQVSAGNLGMRPPVGRTVGEQSRKPGVFDRPARQVADLTRGTQGQVREPMPGLA